MPAKSETTLRWIKSTLALALKAATARATRTTTNAYERIGIICRTIIGILAGPVPLAIPLDQTVSNTQIMEVGRIIVGVTIILHSVSTLVPWLVGSPADWWYIGIPMVVPVAPYKLTIAEETDITTSIGLASKTTTPLPTEKVSRENTFSGQ